jgi:hydrogenase expression/formation protein HypE
MRDPTRGGIASALNEIARASGVNIAIREDALPIDGRVRAACALLGYDVLHLANEGKALFFIDDTEGAIDAGGADCGKNADCAGGAVSRALDAMRAHPLGRDAAIIGEVTERAEKGRARVVMKTSIGGTRIIDVLSGELLPRIC